MIKSILTKVEKKEKVEVGTQNGRIDEVEKYLRVFVFCVREQRGLTCPEEILQ